MPGELSDATNNPTVKPMNSRWETQNKIHESYSIFSPNRHGPGKKSVRQTAQFDKFTNSVPHAIAIDNLPDPAILVGPEK
jgi:hypothetical protein